MSEAEYLDDLLPDGGMDSEGADDGKAEAEAEAKRAGGGRANERIQQLVEERNQERAARAELEARVQKMEGLKTTVESLLAERKAAEAAAEAEKAKIVVPDFLEDPVGHVDAKVGTIKADLARMEALAAEGNKKAEAEAAQLRDQLAMQQFMSKVQNSEATFLKATPDYYAALDHARAARKAEMELLDYSEDEIKKTINGEEVNAALAAISRGKDPAEFAYKRAQAMGYRPGAAPTGDKKLDDEVALYEKRKMAQSIGSNISGDDDGGLEPAGDAWANVESAFKDLFGENLR